MRFVEKVMYNEANMIWALPLLVLLIFIGLYFLFASMEWGFYLWNEGFLLPPKEIGLNK